MDGTIIHYTDSFQNSQIRFSNSLECVETYPLPQAWISNIKHEHKFILGLNFIRSLKGGMLFSQHYVTLFKRSIMLPTQHTNNFNQSCQDKCGGTIGKNSSLEFDLELEQLKRKIVDKECSSLILEHESDLEFFLSIEEELDDNVVIKELSDFEIEKLDSIDIDSLIDPEFCLSQLEHKQKKSDRAKLEELIQ